MCGIAGLANADGQGRRGLAARVADTMSATLAHRGPDDAGVWESANGGVALSHRRLSIIDLSPLGHNPMSWDGGRLWITFNGEIYNFRELRHQLESAGCRFRSQTDTEVVLAAYDRWGLDAIERFAGMFAFALWDESRHRLWLVRDRLGKKPLYYSEARGTLRFASELKALLVDDDPARDVDPDALGLFLQYGYVPSPYSIFRGVRKLPPAHYLVWERGQASVTRYWDPLDYARKGNRVSEHDAEEELDARLSQAVKQRLIADVPLGGFLSGGVDSSLIVALMKEQSEARVRTFTIRFDNPQFNEADHAAAVARHLGTDHHEETCVESQMLSVVERLADMYDEPFADSSAVPTYLVSRIARHYATVALSGDGGDEQFFGYPRYRFYSMAAGVLALPQPLLRAAAFGADRLLPTRRLKRIASVLRSSDIDDYGRFVAWWSSPDIVALTGRPPVPGPRYSEALARLRGFGRDERCGLLDLVSYLPEDILTKVDRASMAVSLEVRAPLLDHRVVEFTVGLPIALKRRGKTSKWLLRRLLYKRVPRELIERPKMGFGVPLGDWFRGPLRDPMESYLAGHELADLGIDPQPVRRLWKDFLSGTAHRTDLLWQMFVLTAWSRRFRSAPVAALVP